MILGSDCLRAYPVKVCVFAFAKVRLPSIRDRQKTPRRINLHMFFSLFCKTAWEISPRSGETEKDRDAARGENCASVLCNMTYCKLVDRERVNVFLKKSLPDLTGFSHHRTSRKLVTFPRTADSFSQR